MSRDNLPSRSGGLVQNDLAYIDRVFGCHNLDFVLPILGPQVDTKRIPLPDV
jgi:hypothetical protein